MNPLYYDERTIEFLDSEKVQNQLDEQTKSDLEEGKLAIEDSEVFVRKSIKGASGIIRLVEAKDVIELGHRNIDKARLEPTENFIGKKVVFQLGEGDNPAETVFSALHDSTTPACLLNAELTIKVDKKKVFGLRVGTMMEAKSNSDKGSVKELAYELDKFIFIPSEKQISVELEFPDGTTVPADKHFVAEVLILGDRTVRA